MADLNFSSTPILGDLYTNPQDAINRSKELGCNGYRTYIINGVTNYIPCSSYIEYNNTLRYSINQGKLVAFGSDVFGDKLVGMQFANNKTEVSAGDPFFTLGNFSITKSITKNKTNNILAQSNINKSYTVSKIQNQANITSSDVIGFVTETINSSIKADVLYDKSILENYSRFSSLVEGFKNTLIEITQNYPGGIKSSPVSIMYPSITNYISYVSDNVATFKVNIKNLFNPFSIDITNKSLQKIDDSNISILRNFGKTFSDYVILYNNVEYPIIDVTLPLTLDDISTGLVITTAGIPFLDKLNQNNEANVLFYIKPKKEKYNEFINNLSDLGKFLLNYDENSKSYKSLFVDPVFDDAGNITLTNKFLSFPVFDEVNINLLDSSFDDFLTSLNEIALNYDSYKSNIISRLLVTDSLHEFDTPDKKMEIILQTYGRLFDEVKKYIDGISYMTNLSYDKVENIPDTLVKNFATMLGFDTLVESDIDSMVNDLFTIKDTKKTTITPVELDIELWRRIAINAFYLFKSKGTRKAIDFILKLVGVPDYIIEINEYVYIADNKLDIVDKLNKIYQKTNIIDPNQLLGKYPFDSKGYPTTPSDISFQENGGYFTQDSENIGPYDYGNKYINGYTNFDGVKGFTLFKTIDNVKSWVYNETKHYNINENTLRETNYYEADSRLSINVKDLDVYLSLDRIIDHSVYKYFYKNNIKIDSTLSTGYTKTLDVPNMTFNEYMGKVVNDYISVENRKTIKTYPTLSKIYYDFLRISNNYVSYDKGLDFLGYFDTHWVNLIKQFTPATSIINAGKKIKNSIYIDNKFIYKEGLNNDINWLGTVGSEFQTKAQKPVYQGQTSISGNNGDLNESIQGESITFGINGNIGNRITGTDPTINQYFGVYYGNTDFCNTDHNITNWYINTDYTNIKYEGNIMEVSGSTSSTSLLYNSNPNNLRRYGTFVVYNNELYRLNTVPSILPFPGGYPFTASTTPTTLNNYAKVKPLTIIVTTGLTYNQTPNIAKTFVKNTSNNNLILTYSGTSLYTHISRDSNPRNIIFPDCDGITNALPNTTEREYFFKSIGMGFAYIDLMINFDCPPPQPHVCYYDYSGRTINLNFNSSGTNLYPAISNYVDNFGNNRILKQPKYYGFSKNTSTIKPTNIVGGYSGNWAVPYNKRKVWSLGETFINGDLITYAPTPLITYIVTGSTITGTTTTPTGVTISTGIVGDMYQNYSGRTTTDPLMHVEPAYIDKFNLLLNTNKLSINLSKVINLDYIFSGSTRNNTYLVKNNIIDNSLYISNSYNLSFDGLYPIDVNKIGPFYTPRIDEELVHTLNDTLLLTPDTDNYVSIQSLNTNFNISGESLSLVSNNPGFYLVKKNSYLKFDIKLYFTTDLRNDQSVVIKLVNGSGIPITQQTFIFSGLNTPDDNVYNFIFKGFFTTNEKIYLVINPITSPCSISRYEKIDYTYSDVSSGEYLPYNDARFRLMFNTGRKVMYGMDTEFGLSIAPLVGKYDISTGSTASIVDVDNYIYEDNRPGTNHYYINYPSLNYNQTPDTSKIFNKLFYDYYKKFYNSSANDSDKLLFDKYIGYDKIDFNFNIKTKKLPYTTIVSDTAVIGQYGIDYTYNILGNDYYLGNTPSTYEGGSVTNNIIIGKNISRRLFSVDNAYPYMPSRSTLNNSINVGTGNTYTYKLFQSYDDGILDYNKLNIDNPDTIYSTRRVNITGTTYQLENTVYDSDIYVNILNSVEYYNKNIINYKVNDMVKTTISSYKKVININGVNKIQTVDIDRVFICTNDILPEHCLKYVSGTTIYPYQINDIYSPLGSRSCFDEIVKYDPKNYSPWGYERFSHYKINDNNIYPYTNNDIINYIETGNTLNLSYGDIVYYNKSIYRFIYNKPLLYSTGITGNYNGQFYNREDVVSYSVDGDVLFYKNLKSNAPFITHDNPIGSAYWIQLSTGYTQDSYLNPFNFNQGDSGIDDYTHNNSYNAVIKLPNLVPTDSLGNIVGWIVSGQTGGSFSPYLTTPNSNNITGRYPLYIDVLQTNNGYNDCNALGYYKLQGFSDGDLVMTNDSTSVISQYIPTNQVGNVYYYPVNMGYNTEYDYYTNVGCLYKEFINKNYSPIFEWLCYDSAVNNPRDFQSTRTYSLGSKNLVDRYCVSRGVLYRYISNIDSMSSIQPFMDTNSWELNDFCLVNDFTFYKDRTRVSVYESDIYSLTDDVKSKLYFYDKLLNMKTGFTINSFSGTTIDGSLKNGVDKYFDSKDTSIKNVYKHGYVGYRNVNNDIIMDYYYDKDNIGLPLTGEFIGMLNITDPCGHSATSILGITLDTDVSQINLIEPNFVTLNTLTTTNTNNTVYYIRLNTIQNGNSNVKISWYTSTNNLNSSTTINSGDVFDTTLSILSGETLTITYEYDINNKNTIYDSGYLNTTPLFDKTDSGVTTTTLITNKNIVSTTEKRTIVIPNITDNKLITFNLKGLNNSSTSLYTIKNEIKL